MKVADLVLRCYAEKEGSQWQVICIDLNLAAQGDSLEEVKEKIAAQVLEYIYDIVEGEDKEYFSQLIKRPAPLKYRIKYAICRVSSYLSIAKRRVCSFEQSLPLVPQSA